MDKITEIKAKLLSTSVVEWRVRLSALLLLVLCGGSVAAFNYIYFTVPKLHCYSSFFYLSFFWLTAEVSVIAYLSLYRNIPRFARESVEFSIVMANIWFILFIFDLKACTV